MTAGQGAWLAAGVIVPLAVCLWAAWRLLSRAEAEAEAEADRAHARAWERERGEGGR